MRVLFLINTIYKLHQILITKLSVRSELKQIAAEKVNVKRPLEMSPARRDGPRAPTQIYSERTAVEELEMFLAVQSTYQNLRCTGNKQIGQQRMYASFLL